MRKFYITGISGVGKSTVVDELNKKGFAAFDIDAIGGLCYWAHRKTREKADYQYGIGRDWLDVHDYICDLEELKILLNEQKNDVVVAGMASNQDDYLDLFDKIFLLHCDEKTFLRRLTTRSTNEFAREKSEQEHILSWYKDFENKMLKRGAVPIDTGDSLEVVVDKIITEVKPK